MQQKYGLYCIAPSQLRAEGILLENMICYQNKGRIGEVRPSHPPPAAPTHPGTHPAGRHVFCNFMGLPDFGGVPSHPHARLVATMFVVGLAGFIAAVSLDAVHRPALFGSLFWREEEP